jgi:hypothetical protein
VVLRRLTRKRRLTVKPPLVRKGLPLLAAAALLAGPLVSSAQATAASPGASAEFSPGHVKVLAAALKTMHEDYASFANVTPGPQDIFDYNIGRLWLKGIDGTGTTVAVIEGWDDPGIAAFIHASDLRYDLPDPVIQTIFPSGPLPAQCPAPGHHVLTLQGMLITTVAHFRSS